MVKEIKKISKVYASTILNMAIANAYYKKVNVSNANEVEGTYGCPILKGKTYTRKQWIEDNILNYLWESHTRWYMEHAGHGLEEQVSSLVEEAIRFNTEYPEAAETFVNENFK